MKAQYLTLLLISFLMFNCSSDSTTGGSDDGILTGRNYISENNLFAAYLTAELELVQAEIDSLQSVIDAMLGDAETQENLDNALDDKDFLIEERELTFLSGNPVALISDESCPDVLSCFSSGAIYVVSSNNYNSLNLYIADDEDNIIADSIDQPFRDLPGVNDYRYQEISIDDYTGPVTITVEKFDFDMNFIEYTVTGYAY
ncbi:hypothetical protein ACFS5M_12190 [Lacinutrix iliipiscaria]|uniref:Uncharacterized protein n=1 Tax=Lacinutrix iliipiscaria TaxID=1230532 RepID=A0ABW5WNX6_9FLAO